MRKRPLSGHEINDAVCRPANKRPLRDSAGLVACGDCLSIWMWLLWRQFKGTGTWHIECRCATCGRWVKWLEQSPRHILLADEHSKLRGYRCPTPGELAMQPIAAAPSPQGRLPDDDTTQEATSPAQPTHGDQE